MVFGLFGVSEVMPLFVVGFFACWQGRFDRHRNGDIWKERNSKCFEDIERSMPDLKLLFLRTFFELVLCVEKPTFFFYFGFT